MNYKRVLIAIDEEPSSEVVAEKGLQLGKQLKAEIAVVSVANTTDLLTEGGVTPDEMAEIIRKDTRKSQKNILKKVFKDNEVTQFIEEGKPQELILKVADQWNADILVMGAQPKSGLSQIFLGSVSEKVIKNSEIPVFLVTTKE